jgi:phosphoglycolate phosphatase
MGEPLFDHIRGILFDFDGTLIDASEVIIHSCNHALQLAGLPPRSAAELRAMIGIPLRDVFAEIAPSFPTDEILATYRAEFWKHSRSGTRLLPGVGELLPVLAARYKLAIVTSRSSRGAWDILEHFALDSLFEVLVGVDDVRNPKPHPEPVLSALSRIGVDPACAILLGDTVQDMQAAVAAEAGAVGVATGSHTAEALRAAGALTVLDSFSQLAGLLPE